MSDRALQVVRLLWVLGYLVGTATHVVDLALGSREVYAGFPTAVRAFWVSLTVVDPLVVVLLLLRRRAGVVLGVVVIVVDVAVNGTVLAMTEGLSFAGLVNQSLFAVLVLATARPLWAWFGRPAHLARYDP